jgi:PPP family 3-phenylpropionic acid transporter
VDLNYGWKIQNEAVSTTNPGWFASDPTMKKALPFSFYFAYMAAAAFLQPYIIVYFDTLGFNGFQIGLLASMVPLVIMIGATLWTGLADAKMHHKLIMSLTILMGVLAVTIAPFVKTFALLIPIIFIYALFAAPVMPFADSATLTMLSDKQDMYGRVRLGGTIGWGLFAPLAAVIIDRYGVSWAFWGNAAIMVVTLVICQKFTFGQSGVREPIQVNIRKMLIDRRWVLFLFLMFLGGVAFTVMNGFLFPYMIELGMTGITRGIAITIATISELPVLFFSNYLIDRFKALGLLFIGMFITGLRMILYAVLNFQAGILIFQLLNGLTSPLVVVAAVSYANEIAPQGMKATAQGLVGAMMFGFGAAVGGAAGGLLRGSLGAQAMFLLVGVIVLFGVAVIFILEKNQNARQVQGID